MAAQLISASILLCSKLEAQTMHPFFLLATLVFTAVTALQQPSVIKNGTVHGVDLPQFNQSLFLGIPYAQPPVGVLRLRPPRSINASFGNLDATAYGPHCWSQFTTGFDDNSGFNNSEDCLTLNVIRPTAVSEKSLVPVVVWIHGGGLTTGGSADFRYNGSWLVQASIANGDPIVFVSINYRLASLGFLAGNALANEGSLNLGVRDQRLGCKKTLPNLAETRKITIGVPYRKVTIQGERCCFFILLVSFLTDSFFNLSAGATSVHTQIIAYAGRDDKLFNQAIAESGTNGGNFSLPDSVDFQATYNDLIANTTCSSTANSSAAVQLSCLTAFPPRVDTPRCTWSYVGRHAATCIDLWLSPATYVYTEMSVYMQLHAATRRRRGPSTRRLRLSTCVHSVDTGRHTFIMLHPSVT
ncbi:Alpha/Beta hydrolase protein [Mycena leptocephala]|nr:Alpha/Beta hydrolase protein [Mycena leptocephala]